MAKKKGKAALICRVSTPQQTELGLDSQVAVLERKAKEDGYDVPDDLKFCEQISGLDKDKEIRKSLQDLMNTVLNSQVDVVYTYELTRISRDPLNLLERIKWFSDRKIPVYIYDADMWTLDRNTKEEIEETTSYFCGAATFGRVEAQKIKNRTMRARNQLAQGGWFVGHLADGYITEIDGTHKKIVEDEVRAPIIKRIFDLFIKGKSTDEIAQILNDDNVPTTNRYRFLSKHFNYRNVYLKKDGILYSREDAKWSGSLISQILSNKWYIGKRSYNGKEYNIPRLISDADWERTVEMRTLRAAQFRTNRKKKKHNYLLSNYFYCGKCGSKMYGHTTGLNNHYYCSSIERGNKCGLRGIAKESIEAVVCNTILTRALNHLVRGEESAFTDFFKMSDEEKQELKQEIKIKNNSCKTKIKEIEGIEKRKKGYYRLLAGGKDEKTINELLNEDELLRLKLEKELENTQSEIQESKKKLKRADDTKKIVENIVELKNQRTYQQLIEATVKRIEINNIDRSISFIKIVYVNDKSDGIFYSFPLLKDKYILLPECLDKLHLTYDKNNSIFRIEKDYCISFSFYKSGLIIPALNVIKKFDKGYFVVVSDVKKVKHIVFDKQRIYYTNIISVRDFVLGCRNSKSLLKEFDRTPFVEVDDGRKAEQIERYKAWRKKYNNGLPTQFPHVIQDKNYEVYKTERKHLYNRKYKIKKNKRLNEKQKNEMLSEIERELSILKAKVKYLSREEALIQYKKKSTT